MTEQVSDEIGTERPESPPRPLCDVLAFGVLAAVTLRIVISIASGIVRVFTTAPGLAPSGERFVGAVVEWLADFGDGPGVLLAAVATALVWWQVHSVSTAPLSGSTEHRTRSMRFCAWLSAVWVLTVAGSFGDGVGVGIWYWRDPERWLRIVGSGGFLAVYGILGLIGLYATRQLRWTALSLAPETED
jgi:hypothetical protein